MFEIRAIQPLGEQIIIRTIPQNSIGSIIVPDSAKGITMMGDKGAQDAVHFVEAEVIAVGPGKRLKGDPSLIPNLAEALRDAAQFIDGPASAPGAGPSMRADAKLLIERLYGIAQGARNGCHRAPLLVKPGDRILYHPSVQKFDRDITHLMNGDGAPGVKYFIVREDSVLAVIE